MKKITVNPLTPPVFLITVFLGVWRGYLLALLTALFHEAGHLIACSGERVEIIKIRLEPFGISFLLKEEFFKSPGVEIRVALAGPLMNFFIAFIFLFFGEKGEFIVISNLFMGFFNLIPCLPLDGGRILKACFCEKYGYLRGYKFTLFISRIISAFIVIFGVYLIIKTGFNFSLVLIGSFLFFGLLTGKNHSMKYLLKELYGYKEKEKNLKKMKICHIALSGECEVIKILDTLTLSSYHIFSYVKDGKIKKTYTEGELFDALLKYGGRVKISQL